MANCCRYQMLLKGKKENLENFVETMTSVKTRMGSGAEIVEITYKDDSALLSGYVKWSIESALIQDALSMRKQQKTGKGDWTKNVENPEIRYITLYEACKEFNINMEVYSAESAMGFQEHYKYENGVIFEESVDWFLKPICFYKSKEEAEKDLNRKIEDKDWQEGWINIGGYEWTYDLKNVA